MTLLSKFKLMRTPPLLAAELFIAKLATFLALTALTAFMVVYFFKELFNFPFVVTFSLPSFIEKLFFFFSTACGTDSSWVDLRFIRVEVRLTLKSAGELSWSSVVSLHGLSFSGENLVGLRLLLHLSGLMSKLVESPSLFFIRLTGDGEFAIPMAYSLALLSGESMIYSPDSIIFLSLWSRLFRLAISFVYWSSISLRMLCSFSILLSSCVRRTISGSFLLSI